MTAVPLTQFKEVSGDLDGTENQILLSWAVRLRRFLNEIVGRIESSQ